MSSIKHFGIPPHLYCLPVVHDLQMDAGIDVLVDVPTRIAIKMRERELEGAFLTPIDYARESSDYCIIPNVAVSSRVPTDTIILRFKEGLHTIKTLGVQPTSTSEIVLASIILGERFDVRPTIVPLMDARGDAMRAADAILLVGNDALEQGSHHRNKLDLVEEWTDMTDLPYVHGFWCVRESDVTQDDVTLIQQTWETSIKSFDSSMCSEISKRTLPPDGLKAYLESFSFTFTDEEQDGLTEFLQYAYYHGVVPDVAELNFYPSGDEKEEPFSGPSLN